MMKRYRYLEEQRLIAQVDGLASQRILGVTEVIGLLNQAEQDRESYFREIKAMQAYHGELKKMVESLKKELEERTEVLVGGRGGGKTQIVFDPESHQKYLEDIQKIDPQDRKKWLEGEWDNELGGSERPPGTSETGDGRKGKIQ